MVEMRFKFRSEPCSSLLPLHKRSKTFSGSLRCVEPHATWHSAAPGTTQEAMCSDTLRACRTGDLHPRAFCETCTSQMDVESEAPAPLESPKPETGRHSHQRSDLG